MVGNERYTSVAIFLHWLIALLVIGQLAGGLIMVEIPREAAELRFEVFQLHKSFGVTILALTMVRIAWRLLHPVPALPSRMSNLEKALARGAHVLFYALLLFVPLIGWAYVSTASLNVPTMLFGVVHFPHIEFLHEASNRKELAPIFEETHEYAAKAVIVLLLLHVGAAVKHHLIDKDGVLVRMLPVLKKRS
jgi:cytochrome b561